MLRGPVQERKYSFFKSWRKYRGSDSLPGAGNFEWFIGNDGENQLSPSAGRSFCRISSRLRPVFRARAARSSYSAFSRTTP